MYVIFLFYLILVLSQGSHFDHIMQGCFNSSPGTISQTVVDQNMKWDLHIFNSKKNQTIPIHQEVYFTYFQTEFLVLII